MEHIEILKTVALDMEFYKVKDVINTLFALYEERKNGYWFGRNKMRLLRAIGLNYRDGHFLFHKLVDTLQERGRVDYDFAEALEWLTYPIDNKYADEHAKDNHAANNHHYDYIKFCADRFARIVSKVSETFPQDEVRFIDVGCGDGVKMVLAHAFVKNIVSACGVEYTAMTYYLGLHNLERITFTGNDYLAKKHPVEVLHDDAFNLNYKAWNFIYMYQPMCNREKMQQLYRHILDTMPVGGIMMDVLPDGWGIIADEYSMTKLDTDVQVCGWVVRRTETGYESNRIPV